MGTINDRGYNKLDSAPSNIYPILLNNLGYQAINPFSGSLTDSLGKYLTNVTTIDDIKNNTWRKTLNNLLYIYKSKGTQNSIRGLFNTYGYPPDVIPMSEFGGSTGENSVIDIINDNPPDGGGDSAVVHDKTDIIINDSTGSLKFNEEDKTNDPGCIFSPMIPDGIETTFT